MYYEKFRDLSYNNITTIPNSFGDLESLKTL